MREITCFVLVFLILVSCSLTGCENVSINEVDKESTLEINYTTDMQTMYFCSGGNVSVPMTKSDTGYYYIGGKAGERRVILYIDKKTQKATPLCSKTNCLHDEPDFCDAYINITENIMIDTIFGATGNLIQYYEGSLYLLCGEYDKSYINYSTYLMKMDVDGSNRTKVTEYFCFPVTRWCLHRGFFYYATDSALFRVPVDSMRSDPEVVYEPEYFTKDNENTFKSLYAYKNYIYFEVNETDEEGNGEGRRTLCINLDTMEKSEIKVNEKYGIINGFSGEKLIISKTFDDEKIYRTVDLNGENPKAFFTQSGAEKSSVTFDGKYLYFDNQAQVKTDSDVEQSITVFDWELNEVDSFKLPPIDLMVYSFFAPQDEDFFIFECFNENYEHIIVMADKSQIGSINGEVIEYTELCRLKWAQNNSNGIYYIE